MRYDTLLVSYAYTCTHSQAGPTKAELDEFFDANLDRLTLAQKYADSGEIDVMAYEEALIVAVDHVFRGVMIR